MDGLRKICSHITKIHKDQRGLLQLIYIAVYLGIAVAAGAIVLNIDNTIVNLTPISGSSATATGTFTFSGNVSNGELVNITLGSVVYMFEFNTTGSSPSTVCLTPNCIRVDVLGDSGVKGWNTSVLASGNLTSAINGNASVATLLSAANTTNLTRLTAAFAGAASNSIILSDNAANVASSGMSGGVTQTTANANLTSARTSLLGTAQTGYSFLPIVAVAAIGSIAIGFVFGLIPGFGGRKNERGGGI